MSATTDNPKAAVQTHLASSGVSTFLLNMFLTVFLPILPVLLQTLAPKIMSSPKLLAVLKQVDVVLDSIIGEDATQ